jgi:hypothetical protein
MRILIIIFLLATLTSCVTQKCCNRKFPPQIITKDSISVKDSVVLIRDTIFIPGAQVTLHDSIPCPELEYHKVSKKNNVTLSVNISKGKMSIDCKADSLQKEIEYLQHHIRTNKFKSETKIDTIVEYKIHWYDYLARFFAVILLIWLVIIILRVVIPMR